MNENTKREAFVSLFSFFGRTQVKTDKVVIRPPYNADERLFAHMCPTCVQTPCVSACPEKIIVIEDDKIPYIVFTQSGCTFCEECAKACPQDVLTLGTTSAIRLEASFKIDTVQCLAWKQTICRSCADVCDAKAIVFFGMLRPLIEIEKCTGCGMCYAPCPTNAIAFSAQHRGKG
ncbi:MAG: ferredoxin-type protein NapF [Sulfurospirillaceae bacterium]|nr:ferredoxin-type protein NapF [Sulfurospirillaceae bacterium]